MSAVNRRSVECPVCGADVPAEYVNYNGLWSIACPTCTVATITLMTPRWTDERR